MFWGTNDTNTITHTLCKHWYHQTCFVPGLCGHRGFRGAAGRSGFPEAPGARVDVGKP